MPRTNIWLILIVISSMIGVWYFGSVHDTFQSKASAALAMPSPPVIEESSPVRAVAAAVGGPAAAKETPSRNVIHRIELQTELENLQAELARKAQALEAQKQTLDQLQRQQSQMAGAATYRSQMDSRDLAIQNLLDDLDRYHRAEEQINQSAAVALKDQDSQAALARTEVDTNVQALEQEIRNTQNNLTYWKSNPASQEVQNQPAQVEKLQAQLNEQKARLDELRAQRVSISATALSNSQSIQSLAAQAKAELQTSAADTQDQIYSLRSEIDRLQQSQAAEQTRLQGVSGQISRVEKAVENQSMEIRRLLEAIQAKQNEIQAQ
jgi:chromosome segregation ATPase